MTTELMSFENEITGEIRNLLRFTFANRLQETRDRGFNSLALRPVIICKVVLIIQVINLMQMI